MTGLELFRGQLLETKFLIPAAPHALLPRPRLMALLDAYPRRPLTLISAPAGFGKTTLLAQWARALVQESTGVAWVSLDEGDSDPALFWRYALAALDRARPGLCADLVARLQAQPPTPPQHVLTALVNRLVEVSGQVHLLLDDYHLVTDQAVHASLAFLVEHLPAQLRVALSTRTDPPFPLSRLRARGQLLEVRTEHLSCDGSEVADLLREIVGGELSGGEVEQVSSRTGGWLAGLRMFDPALRRCKGRLRIEEVNGTHRHVLDYLTEEVLRQQAPAVQHFLLHTCVLERLTAPLCDAVLEQEGSQGILEELKRSNLFLTALDSQRRWFRYHPLFAETLRFVLERSDPETIAPVHRRASAWFAGHGHTCEAVEHALQAGDWSQAADLIEAEMAGPGRGARQEATLRRWIEQLPSEAMRTRLHHCLTSALPLPAPSPALDSRLDSVAESTAAAPTERWHRVNRCALQSLPQQDLLDPLSLRELEVLHLMAQGATNGEIALALALAVETVKRHVSNILSKLGVSNRTQAASRAHGLGLLRDA